MSVAQWEYYELATDNPRGFDIPVFTSLGQEGWELVTIYELPVKVVVDALIRRRLVAVFKRQVLP